jgi:hypothetical protein
MRFSPEQIEMSQSMQALIDFYYALKSSPQQSWSSQALLDSMGYFLQQSIPNFSPSLYIPEHRFFCYRIYPDSRAIIYDVILVSDLEDFLDFMETLVGILRSGERTLFQDIDLWHEDFGIRTDSKNIYFYEPIRQVLSQSGTETKMDFATLDKRVRDFSEYHKISMKDFVGDYYEIFDYSVKPNLKTLIPKQTTYEPITTPGYLKLVCSLMDAVRYTLVKYHHHFGSLERIKICGSCGKLFLEKKYGSGTYCSDYCRLHHSIESEDPKKYSCRNRQNTWLGRQNYHESVTDRPESVKKGDCSTCDRSADGIASGECPVLLRKNPHLTSSTRT